MQNRKAQIFMIAKVVIALVLILLVTSIIINLSLSAKRTGLQLIKTEINKYNRESGSLIHPDLPIAMQDFWLNHVTARLQAAVDGHNDAASACYGVIDSTYEMEQAVNGYSISFLQEGEDISVQMVDPRGVVAALLNADDQRNSYLKGKTLCVMAYQNGNDVPFDVHSVTVRLGYEPGFINSYYFPGRPSEYFTSAESGADQFSYGPFVISRDEFGKDEVLANYRIFRFGTVNGQRNRLCIYTMETYGDKAANSHPAKQTEELFKSQLSRPAVERFSQFCKLPAQVPRECGYQQCSMMDRNRDQCGHLSNVCGNSCYYQNGVNLCQQCPESCSGIPATFCGQGSEQCALKCRIESGKGCVDA